MDEQEGGCVLPKATRTHIGHINHSLDCGSIYIQELFIYLPNCPCLSAVQVPPQKGEKNLDYLCLCSPLSHFHLLAAHRHRCSSLIIPGYY